MLRSWSGLLVVCLAQLGCGQVFTTSSAESSGAGGAGGEGGAGAAGTLSSSFVSTSASSGSSSAASGGGGAGGGEEAPVFSHQVWVIDKQGNGLEDLPVVVYDASNAFVSSTVTAVGGRVYVEVPAGGGVTVAYVEDQDLQLDTFLALPDTSDILLKTHVDTAPPPAVYAVTTYYIAALGAPAGTTCYAYYSTCDSKVSNVSAQKLYNTSCTDMGEQDFLVIALDAAGNGLAWGTLDNLSTSPGMTVAYRVTLSHTDFVDFDLAVKNIPAGAGASVEVGPASREALTPSFLAYATPAAGELHLFGSAPASLGVDMDITEQVSEVLPNGSRLFSRTRRLNVVPALDSFSSDVWAAVTVNPLDFSDPASPLLTWQLSAGGLGDLGVAELTWINGQSAGRQRLWFPASYAQEVHLPALSPELAAWAKPADVAYAYARVTYTEHDAASDYADVLAGVSLGLGQGTTLTTGLYYESPAP